LRLRLAVKIWVQVHVGMKGSSTVDPSESAARCQVWTDASGTPSDRVRADLDLHDDEHDGHRPGGRDTIDEPGETFAVKLTNPVGASIADGEGEGTVVEGRLGPLGLSVALDRLFAYSLPYGMSPEALITMFPCVTGRTPGAGIRHVRPAGGGRAPLKLKMSPVPPGMPESVTSK
jgi:hypothetical protein